MSNEHNGDQDGVADNPQFSAGAPDPTAAAWTEIEPGRFMPRRVRGSFQGRALG